MSSAKEGSIPHVEVDDPATAFHKLEDFTRRILAVPKKAIDRKIAAEKSSKKKRRKG